MSENRSVERNQEDECNYYEHIRYINKRRNHFIGIRYRCHVNREILLRKEYKKIVRIRNPNLSKYMRQKKQEARQFIYNLNQHLNISGFEFTSSV